MPPSGTDEGQLLVLLQAAGLAVGAENEVAAEVLRGVLLEVGLKARQVEGTVRQERRHQGRKDAPQTLCHHPGSSCHHSKPVSSTMAGVAAASAASPIRS